MGNAARHTVNQTVLIRAYPKPLVEPQSVRFVVANALTAAEHVLLSPGVLAQTWQGYTTTGSGLGLTAMAALVGEAFGLDGGEQAVDRGYVGSHVTENGYAGFTGLYWCATRPNRRLRRTPLSVAAEPRPLGTLEARQAIARDSDRHPH
jgi:hypothetical protein